jgi:ribonuclease-3
MIFELTECEEIVGYKFKNLELFRQCFIHSSYVNEHPNFKDNERLEFFGDKIIDFVVTEFLYNNFPDEEEGRLTERRKNLVSKEPLGEVAIDLGLSKYILLGKGVDIPVNPAEKVYSSLYESVVAGLYIDGGYDIAKKFIYKTLLNKKRLNKSCQNKKPIKINDCDLKDYKSTLQEYVQSLKHNSPTYVTIGKTGPDNMPEFTEAVMVNGVKIAEGKGKSKKLAQQQSAKNALEILKKQNTKKADKKSVKDKNNAVSNLKQSKKPISKGNKPKSAKKQKNNTK